MHAHLDGFLYLYICCCPSPFSFLLRRLGLLSFNKRQSPVRNSVIRITSQISTSRLHLHSRCRTNIKILSCTTIKTSTSRLACQTYQNGTLSRYSAMILIYRVISNGLINLQSLCVFDETSSLTHIRGKTRQRPSNDSFLSFSTSRQADFQRRIQDVYSSHVWN